jgi:hypothetical protein
LGERWGGAERGRERGKGVNRSWFFAIGMYILDSWPGRYCSSSKGGGEILLVWFVEEQTREEIRGEKKRETK